MKPTVVYDTYWRLAAARQNIFFARVANLPGPWTDDSILREHKFTNAYRASDRVSQYLIEQVIYNGEQSPSEWFFRTMLFKFFNRIETWELLVSQLGYPHSLSFFPQAYDKVLSEAMAAGERIYSAAYIMPSGGRSSIHKRKHQMHLNLLERMVADQLPEKIQESGGMSTVFSLLRGYPSLGNFLAYQYAIDLNYSPLTMHSESEFVCPGPGALDGIRKCFRHTAGYSEADLIKMMVDRQEEEFKRMGIEFRNLWGRPLHLIDCQNLFCEVDKYARIAHPEVSGLSGRTRIKQKFRPTALPIVPWYPPKWGLNDHIKSDPTYVHRL